MRGMFCQYIWYQLDKLLNTVQFKELMNNNEDFLDDVM